LTTLIYERLLGKTDGYSSIAEAGQTSTQAPHSQHVPASTNALLLCSLPIAIASSGQVETHSPQAVHLFISTVADMLDSFALNKS
jgi:hypothetical protein